MSGSQVPYAVAYGEKNLKYYDKIHLHHQYQNKYSLRWEALYAGYTKCVHHAVVD